MNWISADKNENVFFSSHIQIIFQRTITNQPDQRDSVVAGIQEDPIDNWAFLGLSNIDTGEARKTE